MREYLKIGTRESELAMWQANFVKAELEKRGTLCKIVPIKSLGEIETVLPIYEIGVQGVFTKTLDIALLQGKIDIAVHSLKDVPTISPDGLTITAVPIRGDHRDIVVTKAPCTWEEMKATIATSSIRRQAQWAYRYPKHSFDNIRGNINTRLSKLVNNPSWDGAIFAAAGIQRIDLDVPFFETLEWMLPAPAQGALGISARVDDLKTRNICDSLNDFNTATAVNCERMFLRELMGGCATPIAAFAQVKGDTIHFQGNIVSLGPSPKKKEINRFFPLDKAADVGKLAAEELLQNGGEAIIQEIRRDIG